MRVTQRATVVAVAAIALLAPATAGAAVPPSAPVAASTAGVISTVAGSVGGPARATRVALSPCGVSFAGGSLCIASGGSVRRVSPGTDWLTTLAGTGVAGPLGDGGRAVRASLGTCAAAVDHFGNLVIGDTENGRVRVVAHTNDSFYGQAMTAGDIYTVAGHGRVFHTGFSGDGGPGHPRRTQQSGERGGGRREPADRRLRQPADPPGGGLTKAARRERSKTPRHRWPASAHVDVCSL